MEVSPTLTSSNDSKDGGLCMNMSPRMESEIPHNPLMPLQSSTLPSCFGKAVKISKVVEVNEDELVSEEQMILQL